VIEPAVPQHTITLGSESNAIVGKNELSAGVQPSGDCWWLRRLSTVPDGVSTLINVGTVSMPKSKSV
jgi:hypothetical protein